MSKNNETGKEQVTSDRGVQRYTRNFPAQLFLFRNLLTRTIPIRTMLRKATEHSTPDRLEVAKRLWISSSLLLPQAVSTRIHKRGPTHRHVRATGIAPKLHCIASNAHVSQKCALILFAVFTDVQWLGGFRCKVLIFRFFSFFPRLVTNERLEGK